MSTTLRRALGASAPFLVLLVTSCAYVARVSVDTAGGDPDGGSGLLSMDDDGRFVAFDSLASDLVADDVNGVKDVFLRDLATGTTTLVSVGTDGASASGESSGPDISGDGRFVAFTSNAADLAPGDGPFADVFVRDLHTGSTTLLSGAWGGGPADSGSGEPSISADGRFVAFRSGATNLVPGGSSGTNVFVRDLVAGTTTLATVDLAGGPTDGVSGDPDISDDGRFVAFTSEAGDLVPGDGDGRSDVFVRDLVSETTIRASVDHAVLGDPFVWSHSAAIRADGAAVAFVALSFDTGGGPIVSHVFLRDLGAGTTTLVSADATGAMGVSNNGWPALSDDGRWVAFSSTSATLVPDDLNDSSDVFIRDVQAGTTKRVSLDALHREANGHSERPAISSDGAAVAFRSEATNLVRDDGTAGPGGVDIYFRAPSAPSP